MVGPMFEGGGGGAAVEEPRFTQNSSSSSSSSLKIVRDVQIEGNEEVKNLSSA